MLKKAILTTFAVCLSTASYAYIIGTNLTIDNKTNEAITIEITLPKNQTPIIQTIPALKSSIVYLENGDNTGLLYQSSTAPFNIKSKDKIYVKGRIGFYVGASAWNKYSYLDSVSAAKGITANAVYSCANGGNNTLENKIVISGTPDNASITTEFSQDTSCKGLQSSRLENTNGYENSSYSVVCSNGKSTTFHFLYQHSDDFEGWHNIVWYTNDELTLRAYFYSQYFTKDELKQKLDDLAGYYYCDSWNYTNK